MKRYLFLAGVLLLAAGIGNAQALPKRTHVVGACSASEALAILSEAKTAPNFDLYLICNPADWSSYMASNGLHPSETAVTDWGAGRMFLGPKSFGNPLHLREVITHELEHLRCHCDLGEGSSRNH